MVSPINMLVVASNSCPDDFFIPSQLLSMLKSPITCIVSEYLTKITNIWLPPKHPLYIGSLADFQFCPNKKYITFFLTNIINHFFPHEFFVSYFLRQAVLTLHNIWRYWFVGGNYGEMCAVHSLALAAAGTNNEEKYTAYNFVSNLQC